MSYRTFITTTLASTVLWIALFLQVGHQYGKDFESIVHHSTKTSILIVISVVVVILGMHFWGMYRKHKRAQK
jgi:membrane protein DedA with SNARE-associated domain